MFDDRPLEDWEYPEPDEGEEEQVELRRCPACQREYYEESESCPYCGEYFVMNRTPVVERSWWQIALGLAGIGAVVWTLLSIGL